MSVSNRLEHEHADMLHRANEIDVETSRQLDFQEYNVELVRLEAQVLAGVLLLHIFRTDRMIYEAYFRIEGGEGGG